MKTARILIQALALMSLLASCRSGSATTWEPNAINHPILFAFGLTFTCYVLVFFLMGIAYSKLRKPYGDIAAVILRLALAVGLFLLLWRLDGLARSGLTRLGRWQAWLLAVGGMLYVVGAGLYAFYDKFAFDVSSFLRLPAARTLALRQLVYVLHEEILFRGVVLTILYGAWGHTRVGTIGSVVLTAVLFAVPHLVAVFQGVSRPAAWLLVVQGCIIAVWWGALVLWGASIWPAVLLHYVTNVVVAVQGLTVPMVTPDTRAYRRILWFSIPLGVLGVGLLVQTWG
jgi:membrane protease YdiL (CAAX protease family)